MACLLRLHDNLVECIAGFCSGEAELLTQNVLANVSVNFSVTSRGDACQMGSRGTLRTAQSALQRAISRKESVGEAYRGFMSDVKEELEVRCARP